MNGKTAPFDNEELTVNAGSQTLDYRDTARLPPDLKRKAGRIRYAAAQLFAGGKIGSVAHFGVLLQLFGEG